MLFCNVTLTFTHESEEPNSLLFESDLLLVIQL